MSHIELRMDNFNIFLFQVFVRRFGDTTGNSRVRVSTRDGSAVSGVDYEPKSEMLRFRPGAKELPFSVTVKCNEKSAWHKTRACHLKIIWVI